MLVENKQKDRKTYSYENYVCPECLYPLNECKCREYPPYSLIMVDKEIQPIIRVLNSKGYSTIGCCESHYGSMSPRLYVIFDRKYDLEPPDGFQKVKNGTGISHEYDRKIKEDDWKIEKETYLNVLKQWAENLPKREEL